MDEKLLVLSVVLETPTGSYEPTRVRLVEGLSMLTEVTVEVTLGTDDEPSGSLDQDATLTWLRGGIPIRSHGLRVAEVAYLGAPKSHPRFRISLRPPLWFLRFTKDVRKFRDVTAQDIISKVLGEASIAHRWELTRTPSLRPYTVQYRESKLEFVLRLLEQEGIFYAFEDDGTLVLRDESRTAPPVPGIFAFTLSDTAGALRNGAEEVTTFGRGTRVGSGRSTVNDYDWKKPDQSLIASKFGKRDTALQVYEYPVGYRDVSEGETLARIRVEAYEATKIFAFGTSSVLGFGAGRYFAFSHEDGLSYGGEYVLRRVEHDYAWEESEGAGAFIAKYENTFEAIPKDVPFRAPLTTPRPVLGGTHTAMVRGPAGEEIHTDTWGRAKVQFHWDREATGTDLDSRWIRVLNETSSSMQLARVGWEATVAYIAGDPDRPIGISRNINGEMTPGYAQPSHQNRMTIKTVTYPGKVGFNEVRLDDSAATQEIYVQAESNLSSVVKNDQRETIGRHETHDVTTDIQRKTDKNQTLVVGANETVKVGTDERIAVGQDRTLTIGGSDTIKVGESSTLQVGGNDTETVGAARISIVGGIKVPKVSDFIQKPDLKGAAVSAAKGVAGGGGVGAVTSAAKSVVPTPQSIASKLPQSPADLLQGNITRTVRRTFDRKVGGAYLALAGGPIAHRGNKFMVDLVGGLKVATSAQNSVSQSAKLGMLRAVGAMRLVKAGTDVTNNAENSSVTVGGLASFTATEKIELKGEKLLLEMRTKLSIKVGDLLFELTPAGVKMAGKVALKAADEIQINGKPDNLTK